MANTKELEAILVLAGAIDPSLQKAMQIAQKEGDKLSKSTRNVGSMAHKAGAIAKKAFAAIGIAAAAAAVAVAAFTASSVKEAAQFETGLAKVQTLLEGTYEQTYERSRALGEDVKRLMTETGQSAAILNDGLYQVISTFGDGADTITQLEIASHAAAAGGAETADAINFLGMVTKGYGDISAEASRKASDLAFQTANLGVTSLPEMAASMGAVIPLASAMRVTQDELFGAMATLTGVTGNTAEVTTQLRASIQGFLQPSSDMAAAMAHLGFENGQVMMETLGLQGSLLALKDAVHGDEIAFASLFGSVQAKNAVLAMTGAQADALSQKTLAMANSSGVAEEAFKTTQKTYEAMQARMRETFNVLKITIGEKLLPVLMAVMERVQEFLPRVLPIIEGAFDQLIAGMDSVLPVILNIAESAFPVLIEAVQTLVPALLDIVKDVLPLFTDLLGGIVPLIGDIVKALTPMIQILLSMLSQIIKPLLPFIAELSNRLLPALVAIIQTIFSIITPLLPLLVALIESVLPPLLGIIDAILPAITQIMALLSDLGATVFASLGDALLSVLPLVSELASALMPTLATVIETVIAAVKPLLPIITDLVGSLLPVVAEIFLDIADAVLPLLPLLADIAQSLLPPLMDIFMAFVGVVQDVVPLIVELSKSVGGILVKAVQMVMPFIMTLVNTVLPVFVTLLENVFDVLEPILPLIGTLLSAILPPLVTVIETILAALEPVLGILGVLIENLLPPLLTLLTPVLSIFQTLAPVVQALAPIIGFLGETIGGILGAAIESALPLIGAVTTCLSGLMDFIVNVFSDNWKGAWEGIKKVFTGIWSSVKAIFATPINFMVKGINTLLSGLNKLTIPEWVPGIGGKGISIPLIPELQLAEGGILKDASVIRMLAEGDILTQPTLAYIAEAGDDEAVIPINRSPRSIGLLTETAERMGVPLNSGGRSFRINYNPQIIMPPGSNANGVDQVLREDKERFRAMVDEIMREKERESYDKIPEPS